MSDQPTTGREDVPQELATKGQQGGDIISGGATAVPAGSAMDMLAATTGMVQDMMSGMGAAGVVPGQPFVSGTTMMQGATVNPDGTFTTSIGASDDARTATSYDPTTNTITTTTVDPATGSVTTTSTTAGNIGGGAAGDGGQGATVTDVTDQDLEEDRTAP